MIKEKLIEISLPQFTFFFCLAGQVVCCWSGDQQQLIALFKIR